MEISGALWRKGQEPEQLLLKTRAICISDILQKARITPHILKVRLEGKLPLQRVMALPE
jgi:hypothetical protein